MLLMTITHNLAVMALLTGVSLADRYRRRPALHASAAVLAGLPVMVLGAPGDLRAAARRQRPWYSTAVHK
jgi:hypothetical protein